MAGAYQELLKKDLDMVDQKFFGNQKERTTR